MDRKILIVDDELDTRMYLTTLLETGGYVPLCAANGEEGLEQARERKPALILLDILMPKMGGIRMLQELRKDPDLRAIPVIMLSALSEKTFLNAHKFLNQNNPAELDPPVAYIEKPAEPEHLLNAIEKSLESASS